MRRTDELAFDLHQRLELVVQRFGTTLFKQLRHLCRREAAQLTTWLYPALDLLAIDAWRHLDPSIPLSGDGSAVQVKLGQLQERRQRRDVGDGSAVQLEPGQLHE